ncbi:MAG: hypothetical protein QE277_11260 [Flectobacillus sp.]|nr:hypothetical protein [Flectobacillus sp.]
MKKILFLLLMFTELSSCNFSTKLTLLEEVKPADKFSRDFIEKIIIDSMDSSYTKLNPEIINDNTQRFISNVRFITRGTTVHKYSIVEENARAGYISGIGDFLNYRLGYEYEFKNGKNVLFIVTIKEKNSKFSILAFDGQILDAPLSELTKFKFWDKPFQNYIFLTLLILVLTFILVTIILMLRSKITRKKKYIWSFLILFVNIPHFMINWNSGLIDFQLLDFAILGVSIGQPSLYSSWFLSFGIPIGGLLYWYRRENLLREFEQKSKEYNQ